ncbi:hypothetical protein M1N23_00235 [Dehalococcoidia bacterium]|nr:hypothetical protein [Dehalococcoidia bacterium]
MTKKWWVFVTAFVVGVTLTVGGFALANSPLLFVGLIIGVVLFFSRRYLE